MIFMKQYIMPLFVAALLLIWGCNSQSGKNSTTNKETHSHEHHDHDGHDHDHDGHNHNGHNHDEHNHDGHSHNHNHDHDSHNHAIEDHGHDEHEHSDEIHFSKEQADAVGLTTETVGAGSFRQVVKTSGQILSSQGDESTIVATADGVVSFAGNSIAPGMQLGAGATIMRVSAQQLPEGDPAVKTKLAWETAQKEYERAKSLVADQIISTKEFEQIELRYKTAKTAYEAQSSATGREGVRVSSPFEGYLKSLLVNNGDYVSVGQPVAIVSKNRRLQLRAEVSENYFAALRNISDANFKTSYDNKTYQLNSLNGKLLSSGKSSDSQSFFIPITFEFDNVGDIIPGSFVEVYLLSTPMQGVITVPQSAITEEQGLNFVYLQVHDEEYKKQEVTLGVSDGVRVLIKDGLHAGNVVVTKGVYQVKLAATASVIPEGHSHSH